MLNIITFGARPNNGSDTTPAVRAAISVLARTGGSDTIVFPTGRYDFWPAQATEMFLFVSNNDEGLKRVAFPLLGLSDVEIDAQGSEFVFHGHITPFVLQDCHNIHLTNFTMDWVRTFHNETQVLDVSSPNTVDLRIAPEFPFRVEHERLRFVYEDSIDRDCEIGNLLEFDPVRRETAFRTTDNYGFSVKHRAEQLDSDIVRLTANFKTLPTPGNIAVIGGNRRLCPGIVVQDSENVIVTDVTLHHCGGMGVIAQRSADIRLTRLRVTPNPNTNRMISITADATHFVNCKGQIELIDCLFENQQDDATNIHGIYGRLSQILSPTILDFELVHHQQHGIDITQPGDTVEFVNNAGLETYHQSGVTNVERLNKQITRLTLASPLPPEAKPGDAVASLGWTPNALIQGCTSRCNRARGFLISTPGSVRIENNRFHNAGAAISIAGDANFWFESGAVRDVAIRNNHFENCLYGIWGRAVIDINPEISHPHRAEARYHRNIVIEDNTFEAFDLRILRAHCVDGLVVRHNTLRASNAYPCAASSQPSLAIQDCSHIDVSEAFTNASLSALNNQNRLAAQVR